VICDSSSVQCWPLSNWRDTRQQRVPALPKEKSIMLTPIPRQLTLAPLDDARPHGDVEQPARIVEVSTSPFHFMLLTADGRAISVGRICPAPVRTRTRCDYGRYLYLSLIADVSPVLPV
jgi:hypothetical protein